MDEILADVQSRQAPKLSREYLGALIKKNMGFFAGASLLLAAGIVLAVLFQKGILNLAPGGGSAAAGEVTSVAVLPFQNLTGDPKS